MTGGLTKRIKLVRVPSRSPNVVPRAATSATEPPPAPSLAEIEVGDEEEEEGDRVRFVSFYWGTLVTESQLTTSGAHCVATEIHSSSNVVSAVQ